jgi:hypothetical protein
MAKFYFALLSFVLVSAAYARPPEDQILLPTAKKKGMRILRNKNITYTNDQPDEKEGAEPIRIVYDVKGRSRPDRGGKVLSQIMRDSVVTPFKSSRDKKWVAVIVKTSGVRVWIPRTALPALDKNLKLEKVTASKAKDE